ncbi:MAG TPA: energy-coupling factor transporter transmembrane component T [Bacteroidota bacterium]
MRLDILSKASLVFLLLISAFLFDWKINLLLVTFLIGTGLVLIFLQKEHAKSRSTFRRFVLYVVTLIFLTTMLNGIFLKEGPVVEHIVGISLYAEGLTFGITTGARLAVISLSLLLFFITTPIRELIRFFQRVGLPAPLIVILFLALHFVAQLPVRINQIFTAQEARGAPVRGKMFARTKAFISVLFPLVLSSISETLERGVALDARGFRGELSSVSHMPFATSSKLLSGIILLLSIALIIFSLLR